MFNNRSGLSHTRASQYIAPYARGHIETREMYVDWRCRRSGTSFAHIPIGGGDNGKKMAVVSGPRQPIWP